MAHGDQMVARALRRKGGGGEQESRHHPLKSTVGVWTLKGKDCIALVAISCNHRAAPRAAPPIALAHTLHAVA